jgi:hypothetical protein
MHLEKGLEILVTDWRNLHEDGGTKLSVEEVVGQLDVAGRNTLPPELEPGQIVELIMNNLRQIPGALENTEKFMALFDSAEELLEEVDLDCLVNDLLMTGDDDR